MLESTKYNLTLRVFIEPNFNSKQGGEPVWVTVVAVVQLVNLVQAEPMWRWFPETRYFEILNSRWHKIFSSFYF